MRRVHAKGWSQDALCFLASGKLVEPPVLGPGENEEQPMGIVKLARPGHAHAVQKHGAWKATERGGQTRAACSVTLRMFKKLHFEEALCFDRTCMDA